MPPLSLGLSFSSEKGETLDLQLFLLFLIDYGRNPLINSPRKESTAPQEDLLCLCSNISNPISTIQQILIFLELLWGGKGHWCGCAICTLGACTSYSPLHLWPQVWYFNLEVQMDNLSTSQLILSSHHAFSSFPLTTLFGGAETYLHEKSRS